MKVCFTDFKFKGNDCLIWTSLYSSGDFDSIHISEAAITCANSKQLFEVTCSQADGFDIKINEACRSTYFAFIDFTNSFVWGDATVKAMATPAGFTGNDVVAGYFGTCNMVKLASTGGVKDSDNSNSWNLKVPLADCGISATSGTDSSTNKRYYEYALYWNSQLSDSNPVQQLFQIGQVKMTCRLDPFQLDAPVVKVTEDSNSIADPPEQRFDIRSALSLKIGRLEFSEKNKVNVAALSNVAVTSSTAGTPQLGQSSISYTDLAANSKVAIGDYMELKLVDTSTVANQILLSYRYVLRLRQI